MLTISAAPLPHALLRLLRPPRLTNQISVHVAQ